MTSPNSPNSPRAPEPNETEELYTRMLQLMDGFRANGQVILPRQAALAVLESAIANLEVASRLLVLDGQPVHNLSNPDAKTRGQDAGWFIRVQPIRAMVKELAQDIRRSLVL